MKLSDTQLVILSTACQREDQSVYPVETKLTGGALSKVLASLLAKQLVEEIPATREDIVWRDAGEGQRLTLRATEAAMAALGLTEPGAGATEANTSRPIRRSRAAAQVAKGRGGKARGEAGAPKAKKARVRPAVANGGAKTRAGTKQEQMIGMLRRKEGATIDEIVKAFGWQPHTVRGAFAGALKKKLGLTIESEKIEGRGRVYRIDD